MSATRVVVRDTHRGPDGDNFGAIVLAGASLAMESGALLNNPSTGLGVSDPGSRASLKSCVVQGTWWAGDRALGAAVLAGASLLWEDGALHSNQGGALLVEGAGSEAQVSRTSVVGFAQAAAQGVSSGFTVRNGARLEVRETAVVRTRAYGMSALGAGSLLEVTGLLLRENRAMDDVSVGLAVAGGAHLALDESALAGNQGYGLVLEEGGEAVVARTIIRDTSVGRPLLNAGVLVGPNSKLQLSRSSLVANSGIGMRVSGPAAAVDASELVIRGTQAGSAGGGEALSVSASRLDLTQAQLLQNHRVAAYLNVDSEVSLTNVIVRATLADGSNESGIGVVCNSVVKASVRSSAFVDNRVAGLYVWGPGPVTVSDSLFLKVAPDQETHVGSGLVLARAATATIERTEIDSCPSGVILDAASATLAGSLLRRNAVALHAQGGTVIREVSSSAEGARELELAVDTQTVFFENGSVVGNGQVPLPAPPLF
ncbi:MAG: hypothetical protein HY901_25505 [Deltaproteobacteria bacterium]|nr:hypothetical protein [Deltaproteobacteria bacterium]